MDLDSFKRQRLSAKLSVSLSSRRSTDLSECDSSSHEDFPVAPVAKLSHSTTAAPVKLQENNPPLHAQSTASFVSAHATLITGNLRQLQSALPPPSPHQPVLTHVGSSTPTPSYPSLTPVGRATPSFHDMTSSAQIQTASVSSKANSSGTGFNTPTITVTSSGQTQSSAVFPSLSASLPGTVPPVARSLYGGSSKSRMNKAASPVSAITNSQTNSQQQQPRVLHPQSAVAISSGNSSDNIRPRTSFESNTSNQAFVITSPPQLYKSPQQFHQAQNKIQAQSQSHSFSHGGISKDSPGLSRKTSSSSSSSPSVSVSSTVMMSASSPSTSSLERPVIRSTPSHASRALATVQYYNFTTPSTTVSTTAIGTSTISSKNEAPATFSTISSTSSNLSTSSLPVISTPLVDTSTNIDMNLPSHTPQSFSMSSFASIGGFGSNIPYGSSHPQYSSRGPTSSLVSTSLRPHGVSHTASHATSHVLGGGLSGLSTPMTTQPTATTYTPTLPSSILTNQRVLADHPRSGSGIQATPTPATTSSDVMRQWIQSKRLLAQQKMKTNELAEKISSLERFLTEARQAKDEISVK